MDARQAALELVLHALNEETDISSVKERVRIQKAVYLSQAVGLNLGYSYSWYVRGPYSTGLTKDYYELKAARDAGDTSSPGLTLNPAVQPLVEKIRTLLTIPAGVPLERAAWYELLASLHFLMKTSGYTFEKASELLRQIKPHIADYLDQGRAHLRLFGLVS